MEDDCGDHRNLYIPSAIDQGSDAPAVFGCAGASVSFASIFFQTEAVFVGGRSDYPWKDHGPRPG
jgi:hypothetical protein